MLPAPVEWPWTAATFTGGILSASRCGKINTQETVTSTTPVGSVYLQLSGQSDLATLFGGTWSNVSSSYAGVFFRAEGGSASAFASGQQAMSIQSHSHTIGRDTTNYRLSGLSSNGTRVMQREGDGNGIWNTDAYGGTETRPVNYTVRIWKRFLSGIKSTAAVLLKRQRLKS